MTKRIEAVIHGHVQGVSFRYYTQREAQQLGVVGWVANRADGTVQVVAEGDEAKLEQLASFLHQGPSRARVTRVQLDWQKATNEFDRFHVRWL